MLESLLDGPKAAAASAHPEILSVHLKSSHTIMYFWFTGPLVVFAGIKDLKLMKTTQSGFEGFYKNEHTTLPERHDRILCGELFCKWSYGECRDFDFDCIWYMSNQIIFTTQSMISKILCTAQQV